MYPYFSIKAIVYELDRSLSSVESMMERINISKEDRILHDRIRKLNLIERNKRCIGNKNNNYKNGISKNNYHYAKIQKVRYPEKIKARKKLYYAVKSGKLTRLPCEKCGAIPTVAHHNDYDKPLDVIWLCRKCHRSEHDNKH